MRIVIGADHAGFEMKQMVAGCLRELGHQVVDVGARRSDLPDDYPDYAEAVGAQLMEGAADRGILICGSGVGVSVAANKLPGVRAGLCHDHYSAHQGVEHDDMNVLVMGSRVIGSALALDVVHAFLNAKFSGEERHQRRLNKIKAMEARHRGKT